LNQLIATIFNLFDLKMDDIPCASEIKIFDPEKDYKPENLPIIIVQLMPLAWRKLFDNYTRELQDVGKVLAKKILIERERLTPEPWNMYRALALTPWYNVKVVIVGQDPYLQLEGGKPVATGCSFECAPGNPINKSLANIFVVLSKTIPGFKMPKNGDLTKWAEQGVLLLNASLTAKSGSESNTHKDIWKFFSLRIFQFLSKMRTRVVYMLWGREAQSHMESITKNSNLILTSSHPVARGSANNFLLCNHFAEANEYLVAHGETPIDWCL